MNPAPTLVHAPEFRPAPVADLQAAARLGWIGLIVTLLTAALFAWWSAAAPLAATAVADGVVKSDRNRRVVQHQEGGTVREIRVRDGDHVSAGQVLILLDDPAVRAEFRKVRSMLDSELARIARLEAERDLTTSYRIPDELQERRAEPGVAHDIERERQAFVSRRAALDAQTALLAGAMADSSREAESLRTQVSEGAAAAAKMQEEVAVNEALLKEHFVQKSRVNSLQRTLHEYRMRQSEAEAQIAQTRQKRAELEIRARTLRMNFAEAAHGELKASTDRVEQLRAQLEPNTDALQRQQISAPVSGRVVDLKINTIGGLIAPRQPILEIVPDDAPLIIEGRLRTDAVAQVKVGTPAGVRLLAFDQRSTPTLGGAVRYISADRQTDPNNGASYYVIQVEVADAAFRAAQVDSMTAGMPAELYLHAGSRSALSYLTDPFTHRLQKALREK